MQDRPEWTCTRWIFSHPSSPPFQCWECSPPAWQWSRSLPIQAKIHLQYINSNVYRLQSWLLKTKTVLRKPENVFFASPDSRSGLTVLMEVHCSMNTSRSMRFLPVYQVRFELLSNRNFFILHRCWIGLVTYFPDFQIQAHICPRSDQSPLYHPLAVE